MAKKEESREKKVRVKIYDRNDIDRLWEHKDGGEGLVAIVDKQAVELTDKQFDQAVHRKLKQQPLLPSKRERRRKERSNPKNRTLHWHRDQKDDKKDDTPYKSTIFISFVGITLIGLILTIVFWVLDNLTGTLISSIPLFFGLALVVSSIYQVQKGAKEIRFFDWDVLEQDSKKSLGLWIIAITFIAVLMVIGYDANPGLTPYIIVIGVVRLGIYIFEVTAKEQDKIEKMSESEYIAQQKAGKLFNKPNFLMQSIIGMIIFTLVVSLLMGYDLYGKINPKLDSSRTWAGMFNTAMILVALSGILGLNQLQRNAHVNLDYDKTMVLGYMVQICIPVLILIILPMKAEEALISGSLVEGVVGRGGVDYFTLVYVSILDAPATQFSLVMITIGSFSILIGKARGRQGGGNLTVGAISVAGVPLLVAMMAFVGKVPPPQVFLEIFDYGFAQLIFAISYTSVISLALALVGVFYEMVPSQATLLDSDD